MDPCMMSDIVLKKKKKKKTISQYKFLVYQ